jgi:GT2 family glycosyltransferase
VAKQVTGYNFLLEQFGADTRWLAFIDIDEFFYPVATDTITEVLRDFEGEKIGGLAVNWMLFGSSGLVERPPIQIEAFRNRPPGQFSSGWPPYFFGNRHVKSVVRPAYTLQMKDPHEAEYRPGFTAVNEDGRPLDSGFNDPPRHRRLRVNHYILRSRAEFAEKLRRGYAVGNGRGTNESPPERELLWDDIEGQATVSDDSIHRFLPALARRLGASRNVSNSSLLASRYKPMRVAVCCAYFRESLVKELVAGLKDTGVALHLWALDGPLPELQQWTRGSGLLGKFEVLNRLVVHCDQADLVLFIDDDVHLPKDFLCTYLAIVAQLGAAIAMPAMTADSYHTKPITLVQPGNWARLTDFVESGPVVSMTRAFLDRVTPFPDSNPMGWGLEAFWWKVARGNHWPMAIVDACPVAHTVRPLFARYSGENALKGMQSYLSDNQLKWPDMRNLRRFPRRLESREQYLAICPPPTDAVADETEDRDHDLSFLWAVTRFVHAEQVVAFGPWKVPLARTLLHALGPWHGQVIQVYPAEPVPGTDGLPCHFIHQTAEELFADWSKLVDLLLFDDSAADAESVRRWLQTWVKGWLAEGGVAVFPHIASAGSPNAAVAAVRDWIREQPREWRWQELAGPSSGTGLLWRVGTGPVLEEAVCRNRPAPAGEEEHGLSGVRIGQTPCLLLPAGSPPRCKPYRASVIVAAHNEGQRLGKTIQSCCDTLGDLDCELLVVDDASTDGSVAELRRKFPDVRIIAHAQRRGGPAAKDLGARAARGEVLVFLDGHCKPELRALTQLVADVEELGCQAIVTPRVPALDGQSWQTIPGQIGHGFRVDLTTLDQRWIGLDAMQPRGRFYEAPVPIGCGMAMKRELYERLWGFDPQMRAWGSEDLDVGLKAWLCGYAVLHDPDAVIGHVFQEKLGPYEVPEADAMMNHLRLARKNFTEPVWNDWLERFRSRHPVTLFQAAWSQFQEGMPSVERERAYLLGHRAHDEFWYAKRFELRWPVAFLPNPGEESDANNPRLLFLRHSQRPINRLVLPDAPIVGTVAMPEGGRLRLFLKLRRDRSGLVTVRRATFECEQCDNVVPYASWLAERIHGKPFDEVKTITPAELERPFALGQAAITSVNGNGTPRAGPAELAAASPAHPSPAETVVAALRQALAQV